MAHQLQSAVVGYSDQSDLGSNAIFQNTREEASTLPTLKRQNFIVVHSKEASLNKKGRYFT